MTDTKQETEAVEQTPQEEKKEKAGSRVVDKGKTIDLDTLPKRYKVVVKGTDIFGHQFLHNIAKVGKMGGVIDPSHVISNKFPHYCVMTVETTEWLESDMLGGLEVLPVATALTEAELGELKWEAFKEVCKEHFGVTGRDRAKMTAEYLEKAREEQAVAL